MLTRRAFTLGLGATAATPLLAACGGSRESAGQHVVVVSADMAGLATARRLTDAGVSVTVLEARTRSAAGNGRTTRSACRSTSARPGCTAPTVTR